MYNNKYDNTILVIIKIVIIIRIIMMLAAARFMRGFVAWHENDNNINNNNIDNAIDGSNSDKIKNMTKVILTSL